MKKEKEKKGKTKKNKNIRLLHLQSVHLRLLPLFPLFVLLTFEIHRPIFVIVVPFAFARRSARSKDLTSRDNRKVSIDYLLR